MLVASHGTMRVCARLKLKARNESELMESELMEKGEGGRELMERERRRRASERRKERGVSLG